jgi:hypothetical protein
VVPPWVSAQPTGIAGRASAATLLRVPVSDVCALVPTPSTSRPAIVTLAESTTIASVPLTSAPAAFPRALRSRRIRRGVEMG